MASSTTFSLLLLAVLSVLFHCLDARGLPLRQQQPLRALFPTTQSVHAPAAIVPGQLNYFSFQRPEGTREFYLYVPSNYQNSSAYPFTFYFHGYSSDYRQGLGFNMTADAEAYGWLLAFPQGTISPTTGLRGWNAGVCCLFLNSSSFYVDDVEFAREALNLIEQSVHVDSSRRHTMGWSNGGYMSERLACETASLWSAVAADASAVGIGVGGEYGLDYCDRVYSRGGRGSLSLLLFHGTADTAVPWTGFDSTGWLANTPSTLEDSARWVTRMGCDAPVITTYNDGVFSNIVWPRCSQGTEFELMSVMGGVHAWWVQGPTRFNFSTTRYVLNFFTRTAAQQRAAREAAAKELSLGV